uniref:Structural polyprotein n=1 Tax=Reticulitermes flavipes dicistrovirus TaxID=3032231 RepID=A0AAT9JN00_9VIRU
MNNISSTNSLPNQEEADGAHRTENQNTENNANVSYAAAIDTSKNDLEGSLVNMHADGATVDASINNFMPAKQLLTVGGEINAHTIQSFLSRPINIGDSEITTASTINGRLWATDFIVPQSMFTYSMISDKVAGFQGFRANMKVRLQVNATPFQQGRLILYYYPSPYEEAAMPKWNATVNDQALMYRLTQLPNVQLDLSSQSEATLTIPYYHPAPFFPMDAMGTDVNEFSWAAFNVALYSPVFDVSNVGVDCTLWAWFEDVEVCIPTDPSPILPGTTSNLVNQSGLDEPKGNVVRSAVLKISNAIAPRWCSKVLDGVLEAFGYSKPESSTANNNVKVFTYDSSQNSDGHDTSKNLGVISCNNVELIKDFGGIDTDPLSFEFLFPRPGLANFFTWPNTAVQNTVLFSTIVSPNSFDLGYTYVNGTDDSGIFAGPPALAIPRMFRFWRGCLRFHLKFVKTPFHSGRLQIQFTPGYNHVQPVTNSEQGLPYLIKEVVDIRTLTEYKFCVPYISNKPYCAIDESIGTLAFTVLTELKAPDTVNSTIVVIIEVSADPDFEVAQPVNSFYVDAGSGEGYIASTFGASSSVNFINQGGEAFSQPNQYDSRHDDFVPMGGITGVQTDGIDAAKMCIGERVLSFRQLLNRFNFFAASLGDLADAGQSTVNMSAWYLMPYNVQHFYYNATSGAGVSSGACLPDLYSLVSNCFAFKRGSIRIKTVSPTVATQYYTIGKTGDVDSTHLYAPTSQSVGPAAYTTYWLYRQGIQQAFEYLSMNGSLEFKIPFYQRFSFIPSVLRAVVTGDPAGGPYKAPVYLVGQAAAASLDPDGCAYLRSVGDDFQFGFFTGFPTIFYSLSAPTNGTVFNYIDGQMNYQFVPSKPPTSPNYPLQAYVPQEGYS